MPKDSQKKTQKRDFISEKVTSYPYPKQEQFVNKEIYKEEKRRRKDLERQIEEINEASLQNISRLQELIEEKNNFISKLFDEFRWLEAYYGSSFQHAKWIYQNQLFILNQEEVDENLYTEPDLYIDPKVPVSNTENLDNQEEVVNNIE